MTSGAAVRSLVAKTDEISGLTGMGGSAMKLNLKCIISTIVILLFLASAERRASAKGLSSYAARQLYTAAMKDYPIPMYYLRREAEKGDAQSQYWLGRYYLHLRNPKAFKWLSMPQVRRMKSRQRHLAMCYILGLGTKKNIPLAVKSLSVASTNGDAQAQFILGRIYALGYGVPKNSTKALGWFEKAAKDGPPNIKQAAKQEVLVLAGELATSKALTLYHQGHYNQAFKSIKRVASQGYAPAQYLMATFYAGHHAPGNPGKGTGVAETGTQSAGVRVHYNRLSVQWLIRAARRGYLPAVDLLALDCHLGRGMAKKNDALAWKLWHFSAAHGDVIGERDLAICYHDGIGTAVNTPKAAAWMKKAASQNDQASLYWLGNWYATGTVVKRNERKALACWRKAESLGGSIGEKAKAKIARMGNPGK